MKILAAILGLTLTAAIPVAAQQLYFPPTSGDTWDTVSPASLGWCEDELDSLIQFLGDRETKAFIILKDGKMVVEQYYGTFTKDSSWYWASAGKSLTAFLVGLAQQDGLIDLDDPVSDYLDTGWTSLPRNKEMLITVRHQLTMTTGLDDSVADPFCTLSSCLQYKADAGTRWAYHNAPYTLLDQVMEAATGKKLNIWLATKLTAQTGISGLYIPAGYNNVFFSKARNMARFGLLVQNKGTWNSTPVMTDTAYFRAMTTTSQNINPSYGYLWWLNGKSSFMLPQTQVHFPGPLFPDAPAALIAALGLNDQIIHVVPSLGIVLIRMGNAATEDPVSVNLSNEIWQRMNKVLCAQNGLERKNAETGIMVYPNPASALIRIENLLPNPILKVELLDISGKVIITASSDVIHVKNLKPGIYFIRITTSQNQTTKKIIIQ